MIRIPKLKARDIIDTHTFASILLLIPVAAILLYRIRGLIPYGIYENPQKIGSANLELLKTDILLGPTKALELFILKFTQDDAWIRLASVATALAAVWLLFSLLRKWFTLRVSLLTAILYATSSYVLHAGRLASADVLYLCAVPAVLLITLWLLSKKNSQKLPIAAVLLGLIVYIPGVWIFITVGLAALYKYFLRATKQVNAKIFVTSIVLFLITLMPLFYSFVFQPRQIIRWLGIDTSQALNFKTLIDNIVSIPDQLLLNGLDTPSRWLVGTPILDVFSIVMLLLGTYALIAGPYPIRRKLIFSVTGISLILVTLGQVATIGLLIPVLYILIANGICYLLQSWQTVFPRNPIARPIGMILLSVLVVFAGFYHMQRYFVAWPAALANSRQQ